MYFFLALFLGILGLHASADSDFGSWGMMLYQDVTPTTFHTLQSLDTDIPRDYKFNYNLTGSMFRRSKYPMNPKPTGEGPSYYWSQRQSIDIWPAIVLGRAGNMIYRMAVKEIRKHIPLRFLYIDNLEYEVGYLVFQVFHRYQMMLEVYDVAYRKYYLKQDVETAPTKYMLYLYRRMFKLSFYIIHLCLMGHEIEKKFVGHETIFTHTEPPRKSVKLEREEKKIKSEQKKISDGIWNKMDVVNSKLQQLEKAKKKALKKERKRQLIEGMIKYEPTRVPTRPMRNGSPKHYVYGWSIEDWWL